LIARGPTELELSDDELELPADDELELDEGSEPELELALEPSDDDGLGASEDAELEVDEAGSAELSEGHGLDGKLSHEEELGPPDKLGLAAARDSEATDGDELRPSEGDELRSTEPEGLAEIAGDDSPPGDALPTSGDAPPASEDKPPLGSGGRSPDGDPAALILDSIPGDPGAPDPRGGKSPEGGTTGPADGPPSVGGTALACGPTGDC
jgi:hypothetical protein